MLFDNLINIKKHIYLFFIYLEKISDFFWSYIGFGIICAVGLYLTIASKGFQFKTIVSLKKNIQLIQSSSRSKYNGISPIKLLFTSAAGSIGLGNIIGIGIAVTIGGLGSIFWMWIASFFGMLLKYSEIFLGIKYRVQNKKGDFEGGPIYYMKHAFKSKIPGYFATLFLCIYGVEIYNFTVIVDRVSTQFSINKVVVILFLLLLITYTIIGGIKRVANVCSYIMPILMASYIIVSAYIICKNYYLIGSTLANILTSAFQGQAPIGGFAGATWIMGAHLGMSKTVYSGDICLGYDSIIQSQTPISDPKIQARLGIYAILADTIICFITTLVIALTGAWYKFTNVTSSDLMDKILMQYFSFAPNLMTTIIFFAGFTTIIAYLIVGMQSAILLGRNVGKYVYAVYAVFAFIFFSYFPQNQVMIIMSFTSGILLLLNILSIIKLRKQIKF
jgi:AGCS family alanine or glycine:cation symporter